MTTVKRVTDLSDYTNVLPFASELFGVYQPLLGWKSKRLEERFSQGFSRNKARIFNDLLADIEGNASLAIDANGLPAINAKVGGFRSGQAILRDSILFQKIAEELPPRENLNTRVWNRKLDKSVVEAILKTDVPQFYSRLFQEKNLTRREDGRSSADLPSFQGKLDYESSVAGLLLQLVEQKKFKTLEEFFYGRANGRTPASAMIDALEAQDAISSILSFENIDPTNIDDLKRVLVSPISIVHLFRQYFFELDTFLGTPEGHVWLSPGSSVELVEEYTERNLTERTEETLFDVFNRSENSISEQDEISQSISNENSSNVNFGASVEAEYTKVTATASFDFNASQSTAREDAHRRMREQSTKLSAEIRKRYKRTYRTVSETTEFSRTRHVLSNTGPDLINYELRRKMRQVGVQVQDIGSYLCWQTYVDDPGKDLGLAKLLHVAEAPETSGIQPPDAIPVPETIIDQRQITIPLIPISKGADNKGEIYVNGVESDGNDEGWRGEGTLEIVQHIFRQRFVCKQTGYYLSSVEFDPMGAPVSVSLADPSELEPAETGEVIDNSTENEARFILKVDSVDFRGNNSIQVGVILHWQPTEAKIADVATKNLEKSENYREEESRAYRNAFVETARERINAASTVRARRSEDLREEERVVVYRRLVQDMLLNNVPLTDDQSHHAAAELLNAIFDVEKMLYFVAPEWWRPRLRRGRQQLFPKPKSATGAQKTYKVSGPALINQQVEAFGQLGVADGGFGPAAPVTETPEDVLVQETTGWGGLNDSRRDSYYITEDSELARFGSSLGWLLQLDGDDRRNAFLNSPWVKAVIPIRPGKEKAAINWLKAVEGAVGIENSVYQTDNNDELGIDGNPLNGRPMDEVLNDLADKVRQKHEKALISDEYPKPDEVSQDILDAGNTVTAAPIDRVYEHGFYPLESSFRANVGEDYEVFDQWVEILPTDQTVPVEVEYDPKTGRQL